MIGHITKDEDVSLKVADDKPRKLYEAPKLILLQTTEIMSGIYYLQEGDSGGGAGFVS